RPDQGHRRPARRGARAAHAAWTAAAPVGRAAPQPRRLIHGTARCRVFMYDKQDAQMRSFTEDKNMNKTLQRTLLSAALAALAGSFAPTSAIAAAAAVKTPAPGFYRIMVGDFEVTPISDGTVDLPVDQLLHEKPETTHAALDKNFLK